MSLSESSQKYWDRYVSRQSDDLENANVIEAMAGNSTITDDLIALYLDGKKTAASGLIKDYLHAGDALPKVGDYWIVLDSKSVPRCILKTTRIETCPFNKVGEKVAIAEGEGDLSLEYWRKAHRDFFAPFLEQWGVSDLDKADVVTEFFEVVYKQPS